MKQISLDQMFQAAVQHHQAGRLDEAEAIYRKILGQFPQHAATLHLLGLVHFQRGQFPAAIDWIGRAVAAAPDVAAFHCNLGESYRRAGQLPPASQCFQRAIELDPSLAQAHMNLGIVLRDSGRHSEAIAAYLRTIAINPDYAEAHNNLAAALYDTRQFYLAIAACQRAIALRPEYAEAHVNLSNALKDTGRPGEAIAALGRAIAIQPDLAPAYANLGNLLKDQGRLDEAIAALNRAIALWPEYAEAYSNLAVALQEQGRLDEAIAAADRAIALRPDFAEAHNNRANALSGKGRPDLAVAAARRAIVLKPGLAVAHGNLGNALRDVGELDLAIAACRRAIELDPDQAMAHNNLGNALRDMWRLDDSIAAYRRAIALRPDLSMVHNNLGSALLAQGDHEEASQAFERALELRPGYVAAHSNLLLCAQYRPGASPAGLARLHAEWDRRHAATHRQAWKPWDVDRDSERSLRIGFVSPDFRRHPVGLFLAPVLEHLDSRACAIICYHNRASRDDVSDRLRAAASQWHDVLGLDDDALAARIKSDRIDILFDLAGHTSNHRLLVFARRPAPIQITWMGYVGTTGLAAMDYLIADAHQVLPGSEEHYRETVLRMPDGYVCFDPPAEAPAVGPLPALERGYVTFGSFNNVAKITPEVIALWARIVRRDPRSRLLLQSAALDSSALRQRIAGALAAAGADPAQIDLRGSMRRHELLAAYNSVDLALDPFPYSGGLTSCEALWMGVPVVTWPGPTFAGRHTLSHMSNIGLTETLVADPGEYVERAVQLAGNLPHLAALRAGLRDRMARSALCDGQRFAHHLLTLLRDVWRQWCRQ